MATYRSSKLLVFASLSIAAVALSGCGTYRVVKKTPNGGEVALQGSEQKAREAAAGYMASQCPGGYDIVEEGEAVVGQEMQSQTSRGPTIFGVPTQNTTATSTDKREWRIKYQCKGAAAGSEPKSSMHEIIVRF